MGGRVRTFLPGRVAVRTRVCLPHWLRKFSRLSFVFLSRFLILALDTAGVPRALGQFWGEPCVGDERGSERRAPVCELAGRSACVCDPECELAGGCQRRPRPRTGPVPPGAAASTPARGLSPGRARSRGAAKGGAAGQTQGRGRGPRRGPSCHPPEAASEGSSGARDPPRVGHGRSSDPHPPRSPGSPSARGAACLHGATHSAHTPRTVHTRHAQRTHTTHSAHASRTHTHHRHTTHATPHHTTLTAYHAQTHTPAHAPHTPLRHHGTRTHTAHRAQHPTPQHTGGATLPGSPLPSRRWLCPFESAHSRLHYWLSLRHRGALRAGREAATRTRASPCARHTRARGPHFPGFPTRASLQISNEARTTLRELLQRCTDPGFRRWMPYDGLPLSLPPVERGRVHFRPGDARGIRLCLHVYRPDSFQWGFQLTMDKSIQY